MLQQTSGSSDDPPTALARGAACRTCRRRKVKCDGRKPICGTCAKSPGGSEGLVVCEYGVDLTRRPLAGKLAKQWKFDYQSPMQTQEVAAALASTAVPGKLTSLSEELPKDSPPEEPALFIKLILLHYFEHTFNHFPMFLNMARLRESILLPFPCGHPSRPHPALLLTFYLWSSRIAAAKEPYIGGREKITLDAALHRASLEELESVKTVELIQAELLLAVYYFTASLHTQSGIQHLQRAISLVHRCRLHRHDPSAETNSAYYGTPIDLPPTSDPIEQAERKSAYWAVFTVHNCWTTAWGLPSIWDTGIVVDIPWPSSDDNRLTLHTVGDYLQGFEDEANSSEAQFAKAAVLFERAVHVFSNSPEQSSPAFTQLCTLILNLLGSMPTFEQCQQSLGGPDSHTHDHVVEVIAPSLALSAVMVMHSPFIATSNQSRRQSLRAACQVIQYAYLLENELESGIPPILSALWARACHAVQQEMKMLQAGSPPLLMTEGIFMDAVKVKAIHEKGTNILKRAANEGCAVAKFHIERWAEPSSHQS